MTDRPTADQVRDYLRATHWTEQPPGSAGSMWVRGKRRIGVHYEPDEQDLDGILWRIARAEKRTPDEVRIRVLQLAVPNAEDEWWGCARDCWPRHLAPSQWAHTLVYGRCEKAVPPPAEPATVNIPTTVWGMDGPSITWTPIPLALLAPWTRHLPAADQHKMLAELAVADDPEAVLTAWRTTAGHLADPQRRAILPGGGIDPADYVEAERPTAVDAARSRVEIDPNVRVRGNQAMTGLNHVHGPIAVGDEVTVFESEADIEGHGVVTDIDETKQLVWIRVVWASLQPVDREGGDDA